MSKYINSFGLRCQRTLDLILLLETLSIDWLGFRRQKLGHTEQCDRTTGTILYPKGKLEDSRGDPLHPVSQAKCIGDSEGKIGNLLVY